MQLTHTYNVAVDCGYPDPADPNGWRKGPNGTTLGSIATYKCHRGYITESFNLTIKCLYTGNWSGNAPVCIRKLRGQITILEY